MYDEIDLSNVLWDNLLNHDVLFEWKQEYALGIPLIDEQHRGIVAIVNSLHCAMENGFAETVLEPIIDMTHKYMQIHFGAEEYCFGKCNYPGTKQHQQAHEILSERLFEVGQESIFNNEPKRFMEFLAKWLVNHLLTEDRKFRDYFVETKPRVTIYRSAR